MPSPLRLHHLPLVALVACSGSTEVGRTDSTAEAPRAPADTPAADPAPEPSRVDCEGPIPIYAQGEATGETVCAESERFTIVSLADDWAPRLFDEDASLGERGKQPYRSTYVALANERFDELEGEDPEPYLELFGIFPTLTVMRERLADEERHDCHAAIDDEPLEGLEERISFRWDQDERGRHARRLSWREARVERLVESEEGIDGPEDLAAHPEYDAFYERYLQTRAAYDAIVAAQAHLACEGLVELVEVEEGALDATTMRAMRRFERKQMILGRGHLDPETARALARDSREQDFRALLRVLRERVVDATGLIADGSARREHGRVLGRQLEPAEMRFSGRQPAAPNGAPDRVTRATDATARALGWTSPQEAVERLAQLPERVAVELPEAPDYRADEGGRVLWAEIHRGDPPHRGGGDDESVRPSLTLYAMDGDEPVALVRWPTTIGGYKEAEIVPGYTRTKLFESPTGEFVWRDVVASPAWLPPASTPDEALVLGRGPSWRPNADLLGPGYDSAYGLAMIVHHEPIEREGETELYDEGIRSHGSVSYRSITHGTSHGCHRLYNHLAVRLAGYLVRHRAHTRQGTEELNYTRVIRHAGKRDEIAVDTRGYYYVLEDPVEVLVVDGEAPGPDELPSREAVDDSAS